MKSGRDHKLQGMGDDLRNDTVRIIPEDISDICVRAFGHSPLSAVHTYQSLFIDPSSFR